MTRLIDSLHSAEADPVIARVVGLIAAGAFILLWAAARLTPPKIGA